MICKKCGCDALIAEGDWLRCPQCGAEYFNTGIDPENSVTKKIDMLDNGDSAERSEQREQVTAQTAEPKQQEYAETDEKPVAGKDDTAAFSESAEDAPVDEAQDTVEEAEPEAEETQAEQTAESNGIAQMEKNTDVPENRQNKQEKKPGKLKEIIDFLLPIIIAVVVALLLKNFVFANAVVPTGSMIATINEYDRIIASRLAYLSDTPERYDIIMFSYPDDESQPFVKRVIGTPGDTVSITNGVVYITDKNGTMYQTDDSFVNPEETPSGDFDPLYIPEKGETITTDGEFCYAENGMQVGTTQFLGKYCETGSDGTYTVKENLYFVMGDNRNNSHDSRAWNNKFVAQNKIMGKVLFRYYPGFEILK